MQQPRKLRKLQPDAQVCKKVYFGTKEAADEHIVRVQRVSTRDKVPVRSYLCHKCHTWHLTSWDAPDMLHWVSQMNKDIEAINNELGRQYEEDTRVMSNIVNDTIEDKKKIRALAKEVDELKSRNYILEQRLIILQRK